MKTKNQDSEWMRRALTLAAQGRGYTSPNPMVGAVIVRDGAVAGEGFHPAVGQPHAEAHAIREADGRTQGSTMYVSLEPCGFHGRTPPCTEATIAAGITRVVVAMTDPDPGVSGKGIARLRAAGITVEVGLLETEARRLNAAYIHHRQTGKPFVLLKLAQTLDGKVATCTGQSQWITGREARTRSHQMRCESDGVLVGVGTVLADDPELTVRHVGGRQPRRIILDSTGRTPVNARIFSTGEAPPVIYMTDRAPNARRVALHQAGAQCLTLPGSEDGHVDLQALLEDLGKREIMTLMIEGGSRVATAFLREQAVHRIACFIAPKLLGTGLSAIGNLNISTLDSAINLRKITIERSGDDILVEGFIDYTNDL